MQSLVYIHIGKTVPDCLFDSLYQTLLINHYSAKVFLIVDDDVVNHVTDRINSFCFHQYIKGSAPFHFNGTLQIVKLSLLKETLDGDANFKEWSNAIGKFGEGLSNFRDGFWVSTTARFFYILAFMKVFNVTSTYHIENDNMLFVTLDEIYCKFKPEENKVYMVMDAPNRVVPSILYFPSVEALESLADFICRCVVQSDRFINDMDILGMYGEKKSFPIFPNDSGYIFDGAAIGQYLGGVDPNNIRGVPPPPDGGLRPTEDSTERQKALTIYDNPSVGFLNETCIMKPNDYKFVRRPVTMDHLQTPINIFTCVDGKRINKVVNLHIHSKQLYQFSSVFGIKFKDIVTGDRVCGLADFVLGTRQTIGYHVNLGAFAQDVICIKDPSFMNVDMDALNKYFLEKQAKANGQLKIFIYTHLLQSYMRFILPKLHGDLRISYYFHNSDHVFDEQYSQLVQNPTTEHIWAQNADYPIHSKVDLLPIGIANSMWPHGDLLALYKVMSENYMNKKTKNMYVNINPKTYGYRKNVLDILRAKNFDISENMPYEEYLRDLANHKFCLCIRGNGIDTHRFWESLYLGVIPVVIDNEHTNISKFMEYIELTDVPVYCPKKAIEKWDAGMFDDELYKKLTERKGTICYNNEYLNINSFK